MIANIKEFIIGRYLVHLLIINRNDYINDIFRDYYHIFVDLKLKRAIKRYRYHRWNKLYC